MVQSQKVGCLHSSQHMSDEDKSSLNAWVEFLSCSKTAHAVIHPKPLNDVGTWPSSSATSSVPIHRTGEISVVYALIMLFLFRFVQRLERCLFYEMNSSHLTFDLLHTLHHQHSALLASYKDLLLHFCL